ncbi:hypothetical protein SGR_295 [Streptomyces griseus subsp. griseus NBRC 13350]|uniref:Small hydrophilic protein n=2 Tax=Streptomyces TaxID=1883 RepID=B1VNV1_STRGG|nr:hypothetical protein SGR_295 [Streptomyces griseus subsp. griseus NBRC 13350]
MAALRDRVLPQSPNVAARDANRADSGDAGAPVAHATSVAGGGPRTEDTPMNLYDTPAERVRRNRERAEELGRAADRATDPEHRQRLREKALRLLREETAAEPRPS